MGSVPSMPGGVMKIFDIKYLVLVAISGLLFVSCGNDQGEDPVTSPEIELSETERLEKAIRANPNMGQPYYDRGAYYLEQGMVKEAIMDLEKAITRDSLNVEYQYLIGQAYFEDKQVAKANRIFEKAVSIKPEHINSLLFLSRINHNGRQYKVSIKYADAVLMIDVHHPEAYFWKGMSFKELGDTTKSLSSLQTAVEQDPDYLEAYVQLGRLYGARNDSTALLYFDNAIALNPEYIDVYYSKGMYYQYNENMEAAMKQYRKILSIDSVNFNAMFNIGTIHAEYNEQYDSALVYYNQLVSIYPKSARALSGKGYCMEMKGEGSEAVRLYKRAIELDPEYEFPIVRLNKMGV